MNNKALVLRTCNSDGTSYGGFKWPSEPGAIVKCDDWSPDKCGNGLHGLLDGWGDYSLLSNDHDAIWQIVEIDRDKCIDVGGGDKVKFESCVIKYCGDMAAAMTKISSYQITLLIGCFDKNKETAASGYGSQLAASGDNSQLAASGDNSQLAASGDSSIAVCSGLHGVISAGNDGCIALARWDMSAKRYRLEVGYVGQDGIEANKSYKLNDSHKFEEVKK